MGDRQSIHPSLYDPCIPCGEQRMDADVQFNANMIHGQERGKSFHPSACPSTRLPVPLCGVHRIDAHIHLPSPSIQPLIYPLTHPSIPYMDPLICPSCPHPSLHPSVHTLHQLTHYIDSIHQSINLSICPHQLPAVTYQISFHLIH